jgi:hypothetical protein
MTFPARSVSPCLHDYYNSLLDVEDADAQLKGRASFGAYLEDFAALVTSFGLADAMGTRLLHRHYGIAPSTAVVERCREIAGERVLQSSVEAVSDSRPPPSAWAWNDGLISLEFSEDTALASMRALDACFVATWGELVTNAGLADMLGLSYVRRDYLQPRADQIFVETSDATASTVSIRLLADCEVGDITTVWIVEPSASCTPGNYCRKWSTCRKSGSPPDDRHSVSYGHDATKGPHT